MKDHIQEVGRLMFTPIGQSLPEDVAPLLGCIGSIGRLEKLYLFSNDNLRNEFILHTDSGAYVICGMNRTFPPFCEMRFLTVVKKDIPRTEANYGPMMLFFHPQIIASIEKANLWNPNGVSDFKSGDEIEILSISSALEYLKAKQDFHVSMYPVYCNSLSQFIWCDPDGRALYENTYDLCKAAEFDFNLFSVLSASHPQRIDDKDFFGHPDAFDDYFQRRFWADRYKAYAKCRHGVVKHRVCGKGSSDDGETH